MTLAINQSNSGISAQTVSAVAKGAIATFLLLNSSLLVLAAKETRSQIISEDPQICHPQFDQRCANQDRPVYTIPVREVKQPTPLRPMFLLLALMNGLGGVVLMGSAVAKRGNHAIPKRKEIVPAASGDLMPDPAAVAGFSDAAYPCDSSFGFDFGIEDVAIAPEPAIAPLNPGATAAEFVPTHPIEIACWQLGFAVRVIDEVVSARIKRHILTPIAKRSQGGSLSTNPPKYTEITARSLELWPHLNNTQSPPVFFADKRGLCCDLVREDPDPVLFTEHFTPTGNWEAFCGLDAYNAPVFMPLSLSANNILSVGGVSGGGKTTLVTCMLASLLQNVSPDDIEIWAFDGKGGQSFELGIDFPHFKHRTLAVTPEQWADRLEHFCAELDRRASRFAAANAFNLEEYRATGKREKMMLALCLEYGEVLGNENAKEAPEPIDETDRPLSPFARIVNCFDTIGRTARAKGGTMWADTQRPASELVPPQLRSNMAHAIALKTRTATEGHIILGTHFDTSQLLGSGDCVLLRDNQFHRFQSAWIRSSDRATIIDQINQRWS